MEKVNKSKKLKVRDIQIISFLLAIEKNNNMGRLLEINTGEGKTLITQLICAYYALQGRNVDVVTSSSVLARRDSLEGVIFFEELGLKVGYVSKEPERGDFDKNILFGTVHSFCVGHLLKFTKGKDITNGRKAEFLMVDEVDSMMIDKPQTQTIISSSSFFAEEATGFMFKIWQNMNILIQSFRVSGEKISVENLPKMLEDIMVQLIGQERKKSARNFIKSMYKRWIASAIDAKFKMVEDKDYVILVDPETKKKKVKIINRDTGETQENTRWSNGLHLFVEMKHLITPEKFSSSSFFKHHVNFFKKYGPNLMGLTGTLGSKVCRQFLRNIYNVECLEVPTFMQKKFLQLDPCIFINKKSWNLRLLEELYTMQRKERPCLILFETIHGAKEFITKLKENKLNYVPYLRSDENNGLNIENLSKGQIVVATNLAGRGTDFKISKEISEKGGLHVILTFLASNLRVEKQAFGRAARKGEFGTGRLILNVEDNNHLMSFINFLVEKKVFIFIIFLKF
jgi:preprotein translocase subunit SecA